MLLRRIFFRSPCRAAKLWLLWVRNLKKRAALEMPRADLVDVPLGP